MNKKFTLLIFMSLILVAFCETNTVSRKLTPEERAARRAKMAERREQRIASEGGMVVKPTNGNYARIVSVQKKISKQTLELLVKQFNSGLRIWIEVVEIEPESDVWATLEKAKNIPKTGLLTLVVNDKSTPRILSSLEDGWSILNINGLDDDLPPKNVYDERIRKEMNRAFAMCVGAGLSFNKPCVMEPVYSLRELDAVKFPVISPEVFSKITEVGFKRGIENYIQKTYMKACEEGWAPAPTNAIQQAIWDKVHATPKNPMKIEFDPKKGR